VLPARSSRPDKDGLYHKSPDHDQTIVRLGPRQQMLQPRVRLLWASNNMPPLLHIGSRRPPSGDEDYFAPGPGFQQGETFLIGIEGHFVGDDRAHIQAPGFE
jgi:hypothetical protein